MIHKKETSQFQRTISYIDIDTGKEFYREVVAKEDFMELMSNIDVTVQVKKPYVFRVLDYNWVGDTMQVKSKVLEKPAQSSDEKVMISTVVKQNLEVITNEILSNFDFQRVHEHMKATEHTWFRVGIPSVEQLQQKASELIKELYLSESRTNYIMSGGLKVSRFEDSYTLDFVLESWDTL